ncbi:hypothetical protein EYS10_21295 [Rahnella aquatilis]|nr:hypothetical protein EYS10_21295 [Rahnella aquatilis]
MDINDKKLAQCLKIKFGTAPDCPTPDQLELIKKDIRALLAKGLEPTVKDWFEVVRRYCPRTGRYSYSGIDNSDLTTLLQLATKK